MATPENSASVSNSLASGLVKVAQRPLRTSASKFEPLPTAENAGRFVDKCFRWMVGTVKRAAIHRMPSAVEQPRTSCTRSRFDQECRSHTMQRLLFVRFENQIDAERSPFW